MTIAVGIVGAIALVLALMRGQHPYPFGIRAERHGENPGLYWLAVIISTACVLYGIASTLNSD